MSDLHSMPVKHGDPYKCGYADFCMGRPCCSPWAKCGYKKIRANSEYVMGYMDAQNIGDKLDESFAET